MPILQAPPYQVDYLDEGQGPAVLLVHSASGSNRQWRALMDELKSRYRVLAINLFGYGQTSAWPEDKTQTMADQTALVLALMDTLPGPVNLVGHSLGGVVTLEAALRRREQVACLAVYEPNPFHLLRAHGPREAYDNMVGMMDEVDALYRQGKREEAARHFIVYWTSAESWNALSDEKRARFTAAISASVHEGRALEYNTTTLQEYASLPMPSLLMYAHDTLPTVHAVQQILARGCTRWQVETLEKGGHLAPLTHAAPVNARLAAFLDKHAA